MLNIMNKVLFSEVYVIMLLDSKKFVISKLVKLSKNSDINSPK